MRNTIILAVIAIALAAYVYFVEIKGGEQKAKEKKLPANCLISKRQH